MSIRWHRYLSVSILAGLALAGPGCSCGDDDGGGDRPDARDQTDSAPEDDADTGDARLRNGTIAVTEAAITNTIGEGDPWSGALVRVGYSDATTGNSPTPVEGFGNAIGGCLVQIWDVDTHEASDPVDEGAVSVTGTENGPFVCGFANADLGYVCRSTEAAIAGGTPGNMDGVTITANVMTFPAVGTQTAPEMVGMYMVVTGHPNIPDGSRIPILDQDDAADTLTIAGVGTVAPGDADSTFATYVGVGPVPGGAPFLLGAADVFTVQKAAGEIVPLIQEDFNAHGQGFMLVDDPGMNKYLPHTVPFTEPAGDVTFECSTCGADGSGGVITAIVINGETTDAPTDGLNPADPMPEPLNQYATFQCSFFEGADPPHSGTLPADAMAAILGTNPTRIQTSIGRYKGAVIAATDDTHQSIVLQGHALLGWSDRPPPK
jgi:hypothetical protein